MSDPDIKDSKSMKPRTRANRVARDDNDASDVGATASGGEGSSPSSIPPIPPSMDTKVASIYHFREVINLAPVGYRGASLRTKPFEGMYVISKKLSRVRYQLTSLAGHCQGVVSVQDLKPYATPYDPN